MLISPNAKKYDYVGACTFYLGAIIVVLICQALAGVMAAALAGSVPDIAENGDFNTAFMIVVQLANALFIVLYGKRRSRRPGCSIVKSSATGRASVRDFVVPIAAAAVLLIGMYLPTIWYGYFTVYALGIPADAGNIALTTPSSIVMIVIASVFMAPVFEETVYRGVLYNGLNTENGVVKSAMLSGLAFMLMHMSPVQVVFQFSLGVLSAFIMSRTDRLAPCVMLHASANALALVIQMTPLSAELGACEAWLVSNPAAAVFITLGLFAASFAILFVTVKFAFAKRGEYVAEEIEGITNSEVRTAAKKDGTVRFFIAISVCAVLLIINTVTLAVS